MLNILCPDARPARLSPRLPAPLSARRNKMMSGPSEKEIRKSMFEVFDENLDGLWVPALRSPSPSPAVP